MLRLSYTLPNLVAGHRGPMVEGRRLPQAVYFRQGDLDSACGQHCVLMALIALGIFDRRKLILSLPRRATAAGRLWSRYVDWYFKGTEASDLAEAIGEAGLHVRTEVCEGAAHRVSAFAVRHLRRGRPVVVGVFGPSLDHFVLTVGVEGVWNGRFTPTALLAIDPWKDAPVISVWNARIELPRGRSRLRSIRFINRTERLVAIGSAVALWRSG